MLLGSTIFVVLKKPAITKIKRDQTKFIKYAKIWHGEYLSLHLSFLSI